ncbi:MAG: M48 family metalloprotease [Bacteroidetes bacterium]|nr:M48 family metalloprotease [Bacteroidota bacterium]
MRRTICQIIFALCLINNTLFSQKKDLFTPYHTPENNKERIDSLRWDFKQAGENNGYSDTASKRIFKTAMLDLSESIISSDTSHLVFRKDPVSEYLNTILKKIIAGNAELKNTNFKLYTSYNNEVNAANYSQGVLFINLGVIYRSASEDELAFVICHEMGHNYLDHVVKGIKKRIEVYRNTGFSKELSKLSKEEYNTRAKTIALLNTYLARHLNYSREYELQADSIGLRFLKNSGYDPKAAYKQLMMLDTCDEFYFLKPIPFKKYFDFEDLKFEQRWLSNEESSDWGSNMASFEIPDSLKTHPDAKIRGAVLLPMIKIIGKITTAQKSEFTTTKTIALYGGLERYINENKYSLSLYNTLQLLDQNPNEPYLILNTVRCLLEVSFFKQHHYYSYVVDLPDKYFPPAYNDLLNFLSNINDKTTLTIAEHFLNSRKHLVDPNDPFLGYIEALTKLKKQPGTKNTIADEYAKKYTDSYYLKDIKNRSLLILE